MDERARDEPLGAMPPTVSVEEAAGMLGQTPEAVRRFVRAGTLLHMSVREGEATTWRLFTHEVRSLLAQPEIGDAAASATAVATSPPGASATTPSSAGLPTPHGFHGLRCV